MLRTIGIAALFAAVFFAGWVVGYRWQKPVEVTSMGEVAQNRTSAIESTAVSSGVKPEPAQQAPTPFERLETEAIAMMSAMRYERALELLLEADLVVTSEDESSQLASLFEETVRLRVSQLQSRGRMAEIDSLYEQLTLAMPERAEYYILLAEHRIRMDNAERALPVLAQIENHHQLGGRARELIASIVAAGSDEPLAVIPLVRAGNQFIVQAMIDGSHPVTLMLDTGASMTVLSPGKLEDLGYALTGRRARFSTANGMVQAPLVEVESLSLEDHRIAPVTVGALGIGRGSGRVDGLLGMDFLGRFEFTVDQDASELRLLSKRRVSGAKSAAN